MIQVNFSLSKGLSKNFIPYKTIFNMFHLVTQMMINYSASIFQDNYRTTLNYLPGYSNMIILDYDEGMTIEMAKKLFQNICYLISTTKNHNKLKNNKICERFRMIFPIKDKIILNANEYRNLMKNIAKKFNSDTQATDPARFYFGNPDAICFYNIKDKYFDWEKYNKEFIEKKEIIKKNIESSKKLFQNINFSMIMDDERKLRLIFKPEEITNGNRNNMLARYALWLKDDGVNSIDADKILHWINNNISNPLSEHEINNLIKHKF